MNTRAEKQAGRLFISGGGNADDSALLDFEFVKSLDAGRLLYIPVGLQRNYIGYEECYDWISRTLGRYGGQLSKPLNIEMWVNLKQKNASELEKFDAIYIGGARNSFSLMETFQNSGFIELLYDFLGKDRIIYGGSTGAIILGKYISALEEPCTADYNDEKGLKLLGNYSIFCHYKEVPIEKIEKLKNFLLAKKTSIVALTEKSGLIVESGMAKVIGFEGAYLLEYNDTESPKYVQPGENFLIK